ERDRLGTRRGLPHDLDVRLGRQHSAQAFPDHWMIVGQQNPDHRTSAATVVPAPGTLRTVSSPAISLTLARIPRSPYPAVGSSGSKPVPSSLTSSLTSSSR